MEDPINNQENNTPQSVYQQQMKQLAHVRAVRLRMRAKIRDFMEEETGVAYAMEDDLNKILQTQFTQEQQQNVYAKIALLEQFPFQLDTNTNQ